MFRKALGLLSGIQLEFEQIYLLPEMDIHNALILYSAPLHVELLNLLATLLASPLKQNLKQRASKSFYTYIQSPDRHTVKVDTEQDSAQLELSTYVVQRLLLATNLARPTCSRLGQLSLKDPAVSTLYHQHLLWHDNQTQSRRFRSVTKFGETLENHMLQSEVWRKEK